MNDNYSVPADDIFRALHQIPGIKISECYMEGGEPKYGGDGLAHYYDGQGLILAQRTGLPSSGRYMVIRQCPDDTKGRRELVDHLKNEIKKKTGADPFVTIYENRNVCSGELLPSVLIYLEKIGVMSFINGPTLHADYRNLGDIGFMPRTKRFDDRSPDKDVDIIIRLELFVEPNPGEKL